MRPEAARADRAAAIRSAARAWYRAGAIDDATRAAIEAAVPNDRVRVGPVFRTLLFLFTLVAAGAAFGFTWMLVEGETEILGPLAAAWGFVLAILTEMQTGRFRRAQGGTEAATSFAALGFLLVGLGWLLFERLDLREAAAWPILYLAGTLLGALAAWRWGLPLYAGAAMGSLLLALAYAPGARLLWIALPLLLGPVLLKLADSPRLLPSHRAACAAALVAALAGVYAAVNLKSFDAQSIEGFAYPGLQGVAAPDPSLRGLYGIATALVPVGLLALGTRMRSRFLLLAGLAAGALSIATLHAFVDLGPGWAVLTFWGGVAIASALAVRRFLDSGPARERAGLTAEPLFDDLEQEKRLEAGAAAVTLAPEAPPPRDEPEFAGGGGDFGGGGASGSY